MYRPPARHPFEADVALREVIEKRRRTDTNITDSLWSADIVLIHIPLLIGVCGALLYYFYGSVLGYLFALLYGLHQCSVILKLMCVNKIVYICVVGGPWHDCNNPRVVQEWTPWYERRAWLSKFDDINLKLFWLCSVVVVGVKLWELWISSYD